MSMSTLQTNRKWTILNRNWKWTHWRYCTETSPNEKTSQRSLPYKGWRICQTHKEHRNSSHSYQTLSWLHARELRWPASYSPKNHHHEYRTSQCTLTKKRWWVCNPTSIVPARQRIRTRPRGVCSRGEWEGRTRPRGRRWDLPAIDSTKTLRGELPKMTLMYQALTSNRLKGGSTAEMAFQTKEIQNWFWEPLPAVGEESRTKCVRYLHALVVDRL